MTADDLRYPIGRFAAPATWDTAAAAAWREDIAATPMRVRAAVHGLDDTQLDTPYREGGWTIRQLVHHLFDSHAQAYGRVKLALTEDNPTIKPYDEAAWAELVDSRTLPVEPSLMLLDGLHLRWTTILDVLSPADMQRTFFHPEQHRAVPIWRILALYSWHGKHHTAHITNLRRQHNW